MSFLAPPFPVDRNTHKLVTSTRQKKFLAVQFDSSVWKNPKKWTLWHGHKEVFTAQTIATFPRAIFNPSIHDVIAEKEKQNKKQTKKQPNQDVLKF